MNEISNGFLTAVLDVGIFLAYLGMPIALGVLVMRVVVKAVEWFAQKVGR